MVQKGFPDIAPVALSQEIDYAGICTFTAAMIPLFLGLSCGGSIFAWGSVQTIGLITGSMIVFALFIHTQRQAKQPILALNLFKNRVYTISMVAVFFANALFFAAIIYIPLFVQEVQNMSATMAGMIITPMVVSMVLAAVITGQMIARSKRYKKIAIFAFILIAIAMILYALIEPDTPLITLVIASILLGYGSGIMHPLFSIAAQNVFSHNEIGIISSSLQFSRNMGATIITPLFGVIMYGALHASGTTDLSLVDPPLLTHAIAQVFFACLVIVAVCIAVTFMLDDIEITSSNSTTQNPPMD